MAPTSDPPAFAYTPFREGLRPPTLTGITDANFSESLFIREWTVPAIQISRPACGKAMAQLRDRGILTLPRLPSIRAASDDEHRLLLIEPAFLQEVASFLEAHRGELTKQTITLDYKYWTSDQILRAVLPESLDIPGAFETVGHIAHLNLREGYDDYKKTIGRVILDKCATIRTVVNKLDSIDHTFRFFKMEVLAGDDDFLTTVREDQVKFQFDFSRVYWNSRLQGEHHRLVSRHFQKGQAIADVMAGVGPFALPAALHKECLVFANDLNPESYKWLKANTDANHLGHLVVPFNQDGRAFITDSLALLHDEDRRKAIAERFARMQSLRAKKGLKRKRPEAGPEGAADAAEPEVPLHPFSRTESLPRAFDHYVMNLPASAVTFTDAFLALRESYAAMIADASSPVSRAPLIHCYAFTKDMEQPEADAQKQVEEVMGLSLAGHVVECHNVRKVAPRKDMMCLSFRLPLPCDVSLARSLYT
ncbi:hypothetical protein CXG81DRAFT_23514 [Caulochytrium protostelioides]|uniref:tRNA (guanine(37)-N1)-methyltransferase n=1 Tax=Caulochytrium protostelioides TaxID=1555241 RepID=A0A4P9XE51_9FUNG|nr:hypothetical protein CXG81DRAFT_23514 [Caulochytrium protostelioides]|eukprot:RKP03817.1 hypothetical protein CXG81DRAFT_23514 [Caulochytrium protostelioides]